MGYTPYDEIPAHLHSRVPFKGNSMRGTTRYEGLGRYRELINLPSDAIYYVYSYSTPIAWVCADGEVVIPDVKYSSTTSRQQSLCRRWLAGDTAPPSVLPRSRSVSRLLKQQPPVRDPNIIYVPWAGNIKMDPEDEIRSWREIIEAGQDKPKRNFEGRNA